MRKTLLQILLTFCLTVYISTEAITQCEVDAGDDITLCIGSSIQLGGSPTVVIGTAPYTYSWNNGADPVANPTVSPTTTTVYTVSLNANGCVDTDQIVVTVVPLPSASFANGPDGFCSSQPIQFTNTSTGNNLTYSWNFGNPASSNNISTQENPLYQFVAPGNTTQNFTVNLTVTDQNNCTATATTSISTIQSPDPSLTDQDVFSPFTMCGGESSITVDNTTSTTATNTFYELDWGDGSPVVSGVNIVTETHNYLSEGYFDLSFTVTGENGCVITEVYEVFVGGNPSVGLATLGSTTGLCSPTTLTFPITNTENNSPGTTYTVSFNDGSNPEVYNHPPPVNITHEFQNSSCGETSLGGFANSYHVRIVAENPCGVSAATIEPIQTSSSPTTAFTMMPENQRCINSPITFTNTSTGGFFNNGGNCTSAINATWSISPAVGWSVSSGSLNDVNGFQAIFTTPGTYTVTLDASNPCGGASLDQDICITELPVSDFTIDTDEGCSPVNVATTNLSASALDCGPPTYYWSVSPLSGWSYSSGGQNSFEPTFTFTDNGTYTIQLSITNPCGTQISTQTVNVVEPPTIEIDPFGAICLGETSTFTATVDDGGNTGIIYNWTLVGALPNTASGLSTGELSYAVPGNYNVVVEAISSCGTVTDAELITVGSPPIITIEQDPDEALCEGEQVIITVLGSDSVQWVNDVSISTSLSEVSITAIPLLTTTYSLEAFSPSGCSLDSIHTVEVYPNPVAIAGDDSFVCEGLPVTLDATASTGNSPLVYYSWIGDATIVDENTAITLAYPTGLQVYNLTVVDSLGCTDTDEISFVLQNAPVVDAGNSLVFCNQGIEEILTGFSPIPVGVETGVWSGLGIVDPSGVFLPPNVGDFILFYEYTDATGCSAIDSVDVSVIAPGVIDAGPDLSLCIGGDIVPLVQPGDWVGNNVSLQGLLNPISAGIDTLVLSLGSGSCAMIDSIIVTINDLPIIDLGLDEFVCENNDPFDLLSPIPIGGIWQGLGITDGALGTFDPSVGANTYEVNYAYQDPTTQCIDTSYKNITVNSVPSANFTLADTACLGATDWIMNVLDFNGNYSWDFGNGDFSGDTLPDYAFVSEGNYVVELLLTNEFGCQDSMENPIVILGPPTSFFTLSEDSLCAPYEVNFTNLSTGNIAEYSWDLVNIMSVLETPPSVIYESFVNDHGIYPVSLEVSNFCGSNTYHDTIIALSSPIANFGTNLDISCSSTIIINNISSGNPDSWAWDFGDGTTDNVEEVSSHTFTSDTIPLDYTISLFISNECGVDSIEQTITIIPSDVDAFINVSELNGCSPLELSFENFSSGSNVTFWDFDDGTFSDQDTVTHVFEDAGVYQVSLAVNNQCNFDTTFVLIEVFASPVVSFDVTSTILCEGQEVSFDNTSTGTNGATWDFGDGTSSLDSDPIHTYTNSGTYTVTLFATTQMSVCEGQYQEEITINEPPTSAFSISELIGCSPLTVTFNNVSTDANFYSWDFGDGNFSTEENPMHEFITTSSTPQLFEVTLTVQNNLLCAHEVVNTILVSPSPVVGFTFPQSTICNLPSIIPFTNTSLNADSYFWDFGAIGTSNLTNPAITFDNEGIYPFTLSANNQYGCSSVLEDVISIDEPITSSFEANITEGCIPLSISFNNSSENGNDYVWDFGDGSTSLIENPTHIFETPGLFSVSLTVLSNNGCQDFYSQNNAIDAHSLPIADFVFTPERPTFYDPLVTFTNLSSNSYEWDWFFGDGTTSFDMNPTHIYEIAGTVPIHLIAITEHGCRDTIVKTITVSNEVSIYVPKAFTPDNDGINDLFFPVISGLGLIDEYELVIKNRWGVTMFSTNEITDYWNGDNQVGEYYSQNDTYTWMIRIQINGSEDSDYYYGTVTVIR